MPSHNGWRAGGGASSPRVLVLAKAKELVLHLYPLHNSSKEGMLSDSLTTSHAHKLPASSLAESSSRSSCPDRAGSYFRTWQAARVAKRRAGFSLHNPLTRNPDVHRHSFHSLGPTCHWAVTLIISETPLSREQTTFSLPLEMNTSANISKQKFAWAGVAIPCHRRWILSLLF